MRKFRILYITIIAILTSLVLYQYRAKLPLINPPKSDLPMSVSICKMSGGEWIDGLNDMIYIQESCRCKKFFYKPIIMLFENKISPYHLIAEGEYNKCR